MFKTLTIHTRSSYWTSREQREELEVDSEDLAKEIVMRCDELEKDGFKVIRIIPINSGSISNGTGAHFTESIIITAQKI